MVNKLLPVASIFLIFVIVISLDGCTNTMPQNQYVAVEETVIDNGRLLEGKYPNVPPIAQPPVQFDFNNPTLGIPLNYPKINESLKILYGIYFRVSSPDGMRTNFDVKGIYGYPYKPSIRIGNIKR